MSYTLNKKLTALKPYEPVSGEYKIRMDANESYIQPFGELREIIDLALSQVKLNRYPDPSATRVCNFFADCYEVNSECVTAGNGSDELISIICNCFMQKGEKAMVLAPDFSMYEFYLTLAECEVVRYIKNDDFTIDADCLINDLKDSGCRMLIFSNPCNPTSLGLSKDDVRKIITSTDALVVLDEAYMDFWDQSMLDEVEQYDNLIILRTCSKMLGLAALRVGFAVAQKRLTNVLKACKSPYNVNALSQAAASAVLAHPDLVAIPRRKLIIARNELYLMLKDFSLSHKCTVYPTCTNFVTMRTDDAKDIFEKLKENSIIVRCFDDYLRMTACNRVDNRELFETLVKVL